MGDGGKPGPSTLKDLVTLIRDVATELGIQGVTESRQDLVTAAQTLQEISDHMNVKLHELKAELDRLEGQVGWLQVLIARPWPTHSQEVIH